MDRHPTLSPDGLALYAERLDPEPKNYQDYNLLVATRNTTSEPFGPLMNEPTLNGRDTLDASPFVMADRTLLFDSDGGAADRRRDLYQARWNGTEYAEVTMLGGISGPSTGNTGNPMMTADKLMLYFASDRPGSKGNYDIWVATRASTTDDFSNVTNLSSFNTTTIEGPNWISADGCVINFTRPNASTTPANYDLYEAVKPL